MAKQNRWVLLEHTGSPDDPAGKHFDLLLEDIHGCRSWRLAQMPSLDGPSQEAIPLSIHRLEWLEIKAGPVSSSRGWARRVLAGIFCGELPKNYSDPVHIQIHSKEIVGNLEIKNFLCKIISV